MEINKIIKYKFIGISGWKPLVFAVTLYSYIYAEIYDIKIAH